jgi:fructose-specific phosphotransferase system IIC component
LADGQLFTVAALARQRLYNLWRKIWVHAVKSSLEICEGACSYETNSQAKVAGVVILGYVTTTWTLSTILQVRIPLPHERVISIFVEEHKWIMRYS